jgi:rhamnose transport system permease protein
MSTLTAAAPPQVSFGTRLLNLVRSRETGILVAFAVVLIATTIRNPTFLVGSDGWRDLLLTPSLLIVLAVGEAVVIVTKSVDLSVSAILGLTAYFIGTLFKAMPGLPVLAAFVIGIAFGAALGAINGALVAFGRVPGMVITLGTLYAYRGINVWWTGSNRINASDLPQGFLRLGTQSIVTIPILTIIAVVLLVVLAWYMRNTRSGREFYAIGSDPAAAEIYGLGTTKRIFVSFLISGGTAGLAGVLYAARYGTISSQAGAGMELEAIGAAVIGGVAIVGGSGTVIGAAFGALLLSTINRALPVLRIPDFWQRAVVGALIIGAIILDRVLAARQSRKLRGERQTP